jgi:hypothetical protein
MPTEIEQFLAASDNATDYSDSLIDGLEQDALEDIDELFTSEEMRDVDLWETLGVPPDVVVEDYEIIETEARDLDWSEGLAGISVAAMTQYFLDNREKTLLDPVAYRLQVTDEYQLEQNDLKQAGKRLVTVDPRPGFVTIKPRYHAIVAEFLGMSNTELYQSLLDARAILNPARAIANSMGYAGRALYYATGSPQFKGEISGLVRHSTIELTGLNRQATSQLHSMIRTGGKLDTLMTWIAEGGGKICEYCANLGGDTRTYGQWLERGLPGAAVCKGGDRCRCQLITATW